MSDEAARENRDAKENSGPQGPPGLKILEETLRANATDLRLLAERTELLADTVKHTATPGAGYTQTPTGIPPGTIMPWSDLQNIFNGLESILQALRNLPMPVYQYYSYHFVAQQNNQPNVFGEIIFLTDATNSNGSGANIVGLVVGQTGGPDFLPYTCSASYMSGSNNTIGWNGVTITQLDLTAFNLAPVPGTNASGSGESFILQPNQITDSQGGTVPGTWQFKTHWCLPLFPGYQPPVPPIPQPVLPPVGSSPGAGEFNDPASNSGC